MQRRRLVETTVGRRNALGLGLGLQSVTTRPCGFLVVPPDGGRLPPSNGGVSNAGFVNAGAGVRLHCRL